MAERRRSPGRGRGQNANKQRRPSAALEDHHLLARSRNGGRFDNIVQVPGTFHDAWHQVMGDLTPAEAVTFIQAVMQPGLVWTQTQLEELRRRIRRGEFES